MKKVILIGGPFHRRRIEIEKGRQVVYVVPPPDLMTAFRNADIQESPIEKITYVQADYFSELGNIFPENMFLHNKINPTEFLKNLVLDYIGYTDK